MDALYSLLPLSPSSDDIRLLRLKPRRQSSGIELQAELFVSSLAAKPVYEALSYVWGDRSTFSEHILINGVAILISSNLYDLLRHLQGEIDQRDKTAADDWTLVWADSICINQENTLEKSLQVQRMDEIYRQASRGTGWLGRPADGNNLAMDMCNSVGQKIFKLGLVYKAASAAGLLSKVTEDAAALDKLSTTVDEVYNADSTSLALTSVLRTFMGGSEALRFSRLLDHIDNADSPDSHALRQALQKLFRRDFWNRIWILQEMVLPKSVRLLCGTAETQLRYILAIWAVMGCIYNDNGMQYTFSWSLTGRHFLSELMGYKNLLTAAVLLKRRRPVLVETYFLAKRARIVATEKLDEIYGLLGLARDSSGLGVIVDYTKSFDQVCHEISQLALLRHGVAALSYNFVHSVSETGTSWNMLSKLAEANGPEFMLGALDTLRHDSDFLFSAASQLPQPITRDHFLPLNRLRLRGRTVDTIEALLFVNSMGSFVEAGEFFDGLYHGHSEFSLDNFLHSKRLVACLEKATSPFLRPKGSDEMRQRLYPAAWWLPIAHRNPLVLKGQESFVSYAAWHTQLYESYKVLTIPRDSRSADELEQWYAQSELYRSHIMNSLNQMFYRTAQKSYFGFAILNIEVGDLVVVFEGAQTPHVLRPLSNGNFRLLSESYLLGIMHGYDTKNTAAREYIIE